MESNSERKTVNIVDIYKKYIESKKDKNYENRYKGMNEWYHGSSAGLCVRKHYFGRLEDVQRGDMKEITLRRLRLGDVVHTDIQDALRWYVEEKGIEDVFYIEKELRLPDFNVRGFSDIYVVEDNHLVDIKTVGSYKWKMLFGRSGNESSIENYKMQLATYALCLEEENFDVEKMSLLFYKLGDPRASDMRELSVNKIYKKKALRYWENVNKLIEEGKPPVSLGVAPVYKWECNPQWCSYYDVCGGGIDG